MPYETSKCKVTVLKRTSYPDLAAEYLDDEIEFSPCTRFEDGQELQNPGHGKWGENCCSM